MHLRTLFLIAIPALTSAVPFTFPLLNGFPNPSAKALTQIQLLAGGTLPNAPPPQSITSDTKTSLRLIAFNEIFEVAFFKQLLTNVTTGVAGYDPKEQGLNISKDALVKILRSVKNQEELHALNANGALQHFNFEPIKPCTYVFPVTSLRSAFSLAATFTDLVLGTLQDVQAALGAAGDVGLIPAVSSVIGQEGEQEGFYRFLLGKIPSSAPFLTRSARAFAWSALQGFVVPGSCPNAKGITLPIFEPLSITSTGPIKAVDGTLKFSTPAKVDSSKQSLTYISGQNLPVTVAIKEVDCAAAYGGGCTFSAAFPFEGGFSRGLTIAAVTKGHGPFEDADAVSGAAVAGPGLIEVD